MLASVAGTVTGSTWVEMSGSALAVMVAIVVGAVQVMVTCPLPVLIVPALAPTVRVGELTAGEA